MTIEFFTGFEGCGSAADVQTLLSTTLSSTSPTLSATGGFQAGKAAHMNNTAGFFTIDVTAGKTKVVGFHINNAAQAAYSTTFSRCLMRFVGPDITLWNTSTGITIYRGTTLVNSSATYKIPTDLTHVEVKCFSDISAGTLQVKIDGALIIDYSTLNTGGQDITSIYFGCMYVAAPIYDNIFIASDWVGELRSLVRKPNSDYDIIFTKSGGSYNYEMVNQAAHDGDSTYNYSSTVGNYDLFGYEEIPANYDIKAVSLITVARKDDVGSRSLRNISEQSSIGYDLTEAVLGNIYPASAGNPPIRDIMIVSPNTDPWTPAVFNAIKWGYKITL